MGTGIMGAIPLSFRFSKPSWGFESEGQRNKEKFTKHAPKDFFDFYNEVQKEDKEEKPVTYYAIKPEMLLPNFKDFFYEFYELIGEDPNRDGNESNNKFNDEYDAIVASNDLEKFTKFFDDEMGYVPAIFPYFRPMYFTNCENLLVYQGSYKAILEEWSTLSHMERLLWAAMKNPLAKVMRFGMSM
jgi:hypothetical protein